MLDTIMWDIIYPCNLAVIAAWNFASTYLDGLLHISDYTRQRFNFRFPVAPHVKQAVSYLSFNARDYRIDSSGQSGEPPGEILILGNDYDHKWLLGAVELISDAFPFNTIVAMGAGQSWRPNVRAVPSGKLEVEEIDRLYAGARILCYPSFYEGFGLPVVKGIAYGLDVVARRSDLLEEVASLCSGPGRIVPFDDPLGLVESIGRVLTGREVETLPLGTRIPAGAESMTWKDVAARIVALVDEMTADTSPQIYDSREAALRLIWPSGYGAV
jgi:glycosyltransferase involved in cell wall biosynthesis